MLSKWRFGVHLERIHCNGNITVWVWQIHHHDIIILFVRPANHHAIIILWIVWVQVTVQLIWTGTSACYHHLVCWTDTSTSCEFDGHIGMLSSCDSCDVWQTHRHAIIILWVVWVRLTNRSLIRSLIRLARTLFNTGWTAWWLITASPCEFDRHIGILS